MTAGKLMLGLCVAFLILGTYGLIRNIIAKIKENRRRNQYNQAVHKNGSSSLK